MLADSREHRPGVRGSFDLTLMELPPQRGFLVAVNGTNTRVCSVTMRSAGKLPESGTGHVWRRRSPDGTMVGDMVTTATDPRRRGSRVRVLEPRLAGGRLRRALSARRRDRGQASGMFARLPAAIRAPHAGL